MDNEVAAEIDRMADQAVGIRDGLATATSTLRDALTELTALREQMEAVLEEMRHFANQAVSAITSGEDLLRGFSERITASTDLIAAHEAVLAAFTEKELHLRAQAMMHRRADGDERA